MSHHHTYDTFIVQLPPFLALFRDEFKFNSKRGGVERRRRKEA
jgi:hypothetical protein